MRISYRTHPVLESLDSGKLRYSVYQSDAHFLQNQTEVTRFEEIFSSASKDVGNNAIGIYNVSQTFVDAYKKAASKLFRSDLIREVSPFSKIFIFPSGEVTIISLGGRSRKGFSGPAGTVNTSYLGGLVIGFKGNAVLYSGQISIKYSEDRGPAGEKAHAIFFDDELDFETNFSGFKSSAVDFLEPHIRSCLGLHLFIDHASVETLLLPAGQKVKGVDCNYKNDTKSNITYLDSKWFTNLVKSDAFKVRGHFRLQPKKKDGEWTKELIWINDFMKEGYTAQARMLSQQ